MSAGKFIVPNASDPTYGLGICARCSRKFKLAELHPDPNYPALMVCDEDTGEDDSPLACDKVCFSPPVPRPPRPH